MVPVPFTKENSVISQTRPYLPGIASLDDGRRRSSAREGALVYPPSSRRRCFTLANVDDRYDLSNLASAVSPGMVISAGGRRIARSKQPIFEYLLGIPTDESTVCF